MTSSDKAGTGQHAEAVAAKLLAPGRRVLVWGPTGTGKSTLAARVAAGRVHADLACWGIAADPGSPGFGLPGTISLGRWEPEDWRTLDLIPLCTLDAARFRLPLVEALRRLAAGIPADATVLIDAPGVVRGTAAAELLAGMVTATGAAAVLAILPETGAEAEAARSALTGLPVPIATARPSPFARTRSKHRRAKDRTGRWERWLRTATDQEIDLCQLPAEGVPPRLPQHWKGHQIALLSAQGETLALGEVTSAREWRLWTRLVSLSTQSGDAATLLVRDAVRASGGLLRTVRSPVTERRPAQLPPDVAAPDPAAENHALFAHLRVASAYLLNGIFGDPLLHIRLRQERRSLLFDLGDSGRLPAKIAHQVSDVFVSHAHIDHIGGFLWFLRSRIGCTRLCRIYGPPGVAAHISAFVAGVHWDRIADLGPRFEIVELDRSFLHRFALRVGGKGCEPLGTVPLGEDGTLLEEPGLKVRAIEMDHGIPVLAFALEIPPALHVRPELLHRVGLPAGPWVGELKRRLQAGEEGAEILLPGGRRVRAGELGAQLVTRHANKRLVYATDLADTPCNRERLIRFAHRADIFFCEASFREQDAEQARRTGHLTARACGEIAADGQVSRLVPFHFSRRYERAPASVYAEVRQVFREELLEDSGEECGALDNAHRQQF
jgi:ribonuclease Z